MINENILQSQNCSFTFSTKIDWSILNTNIQSILLTAVLLITVVSLGCLFWKFILPLIRDKKWEAVEVNIRLGDIGNVTIRPNHEIMRIAHEGWIEIITRKAGLKFDEDNDVILEIYNSWYELFKEFRELAKTIPAEKIREYEDARTVMEIFIRSLNEGLRPHLTKYQAKYRKWYEKAINENSNKSPQEIQKMYPEYNELIKDLKEVNDQMVLFAEALRLIAHGKPRNKQ